MNGIQGLFGLLMKLAVVGLLLVIVGCADSSGQSGQNPTPTPTPFIMSGSSVDATHFGAAVSSLEERIYQADVVVKARLLSTSTDVLTFTANTYMKGTGPTTFSVRAETDGRDTQWDGHDAVLFLTELTGETESFEFLDSTSWTYMGVPPFVPTEYNGDLPEGYNVGTRNPVWLPVSPVQSLGGVGRQSNAPPSPDITTELSPSGSRVTVTESELQAKIAWMDSPIVSRGAPRGASSSTTTNSVAVRESHDFCIVRALEYIRQDRGWLAYYGEQYSPKSLGISMYSGLGAGVAVLDFSPEQSPEYNQYRIFGDDASLFESRRYDTDSDPRNGYNYDAVTRRPLPGGSYEFNHDLYKWWHIPCEFQDPDSYTAITLAVVAPEGTLHEAFFDPATTTAGVGYLAGPATTTGVLSPAEFSTGSASTTITGLKWQSGSVVLSLSPFASLGDYQLEFIALDGTTALALRASDATADSAAGTLAWAVADRPWSAGDRLMLRIGPGADSAPAPQGVSVSLSDSIFTISWNAVADASLYRVQRRTGGAGEWTSLPAATSTSHTFSPQGGVACGATYEFRAQAHGDGHTYFAGWGAPSEVVSHTTGMCNLPPVFRTSTYAFSVPEDAATNTVVGTVSATDPNGDAVSYSITSGNDGGAFSMDGNGGSIAVAIPLDYETTASYTLTAQAADGNGSTATSMVEIAVTDVAETPPPPQDLRVSLANNTFTISWSAVSDASLYRVQRRTAGDGGEWTSLPAATSTSHTFTPQGGVACGATYEFRVQARGDGHTYFAEWGAPSEVVSHTTRTCNLPPVFRTSAYTFSVAENSSVWTVVGTVLATDPDPGDTVTYRITSGNEGGKFRIRSRHYRGQILVRRPLDYERVSSYKLTVEARDGNQNGTARATVKIGVINVAD